MLLEQAIGDAYGAPFEAQPIDFVKSLNNPSAGYQSRNPDDTRFSNPNAEPGVGYYTDDTQMSIALAEHILEGRPWTPEAVAQSFVDVYLRDPRPWAYSSRLRRAFSECGQSGEDFYRCLKEGRPSTANGAAMRAPVMGYLVAFPDEDEESPTKGETVCLAQCEATNHQNVALQAAELVQSTAADLMYYGSIYPGEFRFPKNVAELEFEWQLSWPVPFGFAMATVWAAFRAIRMNKVSLDYGKLLRRCVSFGGDTDTTAAVAMALASFGFKRETMPGVLVENLENGEFGRDYLIELDVQLGKYVRGEEEEQWAP